MKLLAIALLFMSAAALPTKQDEPVDVSIIQLIASPNQFDGKLVRVKGFLRLEFEGDELYLHHEDYEKGLSENGIAVYTDAVVQQKSTALNLHYVFLEGIFSSRKTGHLGIPSSSIEQIRSAEIWKFERELPVRKDP